MSKIIELPEITSRWYSTLDLFPEWPTSWPGTFVEGIFPDMNIFLNVVSCEINGESYGAKTFVMREYLIEDKNEEERLVYMKEVEDWNRERVRRWLTKNPPPG